MSESAATITYDPALAELTRMEVPKPLTQEQVDFYISEGYLLVDDVLGQVEMDEILADIVRLVRGGYPCPGVESVDDSMTDKEVMESFSGIIQPHFVSPVIMKYIKHAKICGMLTSCWPRMCLIGTAASSACSPWCS